jgi:hypothetical protein
MVGYFLRTTGGQPPQKGGQPADNLEQLALGRMGCNPDNLYIGCPVAPGGFAVVRCPVPFVSIDRVVGLSVQFLNCRVNIFTRPGAFRLALGNSVGAAEIQIGSIGGWVVVV